MIVATYIYIGQFEYLHLSDTMGTDVIYTCIKFLLHGNSHCIE